MRLLDFMHAKLLKILQRNRLVQAATLLHWRLQHFSCTFTTPSKMTASAPLLLSRFRTYASWIRLFSRQFLSQLHAGNFLRPFQMAPSVFNRRFWRWWTLPWLNHILNWMKLYKMRKPSRLQSPNCLRTNPSCWEARLSWHSCCCSRWTHSGWSSQWSKTSIKTLINF